MVMVQKKESLVMLKQKEFKKIKEIKNKSKK